MAYSGGIRERQTIKGPMPTIGHVVYLKGDERVKSNKMLGRYFLWFLFLTALLVTVGYLTALATPAHAKTWTKAEQRKVLKKATRHFHVSGGWIIPKGIKAIRGESRGNDKAKHGKYLGILQFAKGWAKPTSRHGWAPGHKHKDWRKCGSCSIYRFVKFYKTNGKAGIRQHWAATL